MFVYNRGSSNNDTRPAWAIGTRVTAWIVTSALAWPLLDTVTDLPIALLVYTVATAVVVVLQLVEQRFALYLLGGFVRAAQVLCELVVISQIVFHTGAMRSPSIYLYLMTIVSAAISYRLAGTLLVAFAASASYLTVIWMDAGQGFSVFKPEQWLAVLYMAPDEDFFAVFVRICIFFLCAFSGGYLAERLSSKDQVLAHTTEALKVAKLETGDILKHLQSGILTVDLASNIVFFNRAAEEILGMPVRKVRGHSIREAFGVQFPELVERLETALESQRMDLRTELTLRRIDGRVIPIGFSTSVLGGMGGRPRGLISIFQDLTEPKMIEEKMRAQDRLAAIGELSAAIAHEIRNPLASISGSVEVLRSELNVEDANRKLLDLIIKESGRLNKILTDFLTYARIRPTISGRVAVLPVLDEVFELVRHRFDGMPGLVLRRRIKNEDLSIKADADHLKQMLINLMFNAVEAMEGRDGEVTVAISPPTESQVVLAGLQPGSPDHWVAISVVDNGSGMSPELQQRLFEPFVSTKSTGTGLGLAIVSRLAQHAGGQVRVDSTLGQGSTFTLLMPRYSTAVAAASQASLPSIGRG